METNIQTNLQNIPPLYAHEEVRHDYHWMQYVMVALLLFFISIGGFLFLLNRQNAVHSQPQTVADNNNTVSLQKPARGGNLKISVESPKRLKVGQPVLAIIQADSSEKDIVGFDILLTYDPAILDVPTVTSMNSHFQIASFTKKRGFVSVTGTKSSVNQGTNVFTNTPLVKLTFSPLKVGSVDISIQQQVNTEKTKFIDTSFQHIYPQAGLATLEIL